MCKHPIWQHWDIAYTKAGTQQNNLELSRRRKTVWVIASFLAIFALLVGYHGRLH
ncbi:hypothetical protein CMEL01_12288 [Colletotrichum melonis]|uniref:Uncharacterized protein n=1 Tax=Colletotrichum melonis TaxID=1209925 RepID=A0AAI9UUE2_9PEZI|nr:hypothetical protein CMEL01_12288 [Colletotrichum melonis]